MRLSTATSAVDEPEMPAKNMLNSVTTCASPPRRCPTSVCASRIMRLVTSADVISSPTSRKNGTASRVSESMPWNIWPTIDCMLIGVSAAGDEHAGHQREGDRHAHVAEAQEQAVISSRIAPLRHFTIARKIVGVFGPLEAVAPAIDDLLDENSTISTPAIGTLAV